jgi:hypothetical protein
LEFKHPIDFTFSKRPPVPANHKSSVTQSIMGRFDFFLSPTTRTSMTGIKRSGSANVCQLFVTTRSRKYFLVSIYREFIRDLHIHFRQIRSMRRWIVTIPWSTFEGGFVRRKTLTWDFLSPKSTCHLRSYHIWRMSNMSVI